MRRHPPALRRRFTIPLGTASALVKHRLLGKEVPLSVTIALTNRCPRRCSYCGNWRRASEDERSSSWWQALLAALWTRGTRRVGFTGGEPLMFEGILDVVSTARELGMLVSMGTNGVLVPDHDAVIDQLDSLVVSVDGPRDITDRQRFPGAFDAALKAIEVARSKGVGAMVTTVVTRDSADEIERILEWARRDGLNMNLQLPFHPPGYSGQDNGGQLPTAEQIRRVVHLVMAPEYAATVVINSSEYWKRVSHWCIENADVRELSPRSGSWFTTCRGGQLFGHLEPDGRYYPCANLVGSFPARMVDARESDIAVSLATAVRHASRRTCGSCLSTYAFEQNLLFNLFPHSVARWTREILS